MVNGRAVGLASKDEWSGHLGSPKTLKLYEGHFHDLLNDLGREQVITA